MSKVTTFLAFREKGAKAMELYTSLIPNSKIVSVHLSEGGPIPAGALMYGVFELDGYRFKAMDGGPHFKFSEASSIFVSCETQAEVDNLWNSLTADGGEESMCGWLKDKYGISWQIIPNVLMELMSGPDRERAGRVMQAMLKMRKIDIKTIEEA
jgi:predicted 3-demethylubiquinone-9 3-methyltransferase (glyoxalase superfamily)